ncbi:MAG: hypothetical protein ACI9QL_005208, partial [Candidatus Omnitrophota bacterium]
METAGGSVTRAGGLGMAAMVAGGSPEHQHMVDSSYDQCVDYARESFVNSFIGLHKLFNLLVFGGNFPVVLVGGRIDDDSDGAPDLWEIDHGFDESNIADGTLDADDDGTPNWLEARLSLNPHDAAERFSVSLVPPGDSSAGTILLGPLARGVSFTVECSGSLGAAWTPWIGTSEPAAFTPVWSEV